MKNIIITLILASTFTIGANAFNPSTNYLPLMNEAYVNDIPFNTSLIAAINTPGSSMNSVLQLTDEPFINDLPFDTRAVSEKTKRNLSIIPLLSLDDEPYASDLPFDTASLASMVQ